MKEMEAACWEIRDDDPWIHLPVENVKRNLETLVQAAEWPIQQLCKLLYLKNVQFAFYLRLRLQALQ